MLRALLLPAFLLLAAAPAQASDVCAGVWTDASCGLVAVSVFGDASATFVAASGTGDASTSIWCLEWVCPSVAASAAGGHAHASCQVSSVCVAVSPFGPASHDGIGVDVSLCNLANVLCLRPPALP